MSNIFKMQRIVFLSLFVFSVAGNIYLYELYEATKISFTQSLNIKNKDEVSNIERKLRDNAREILKTEMQKEKVKNDLYEAAKDTNLKEIQKNQMLLRELESNSTKILEKIKEKK